MLCTEPSEEFLYKLDWKHLIKIKEKYYEDRKNWEQMFKLLGGEEYNTMQFSRKWGKGLK